MGFDIFHVSEYTENDFKNDQLHLRNEEETKVNEHQFEHIRSRYDSIRSANDLDI